MAKAKAKTKAKAKAAAKGAKAKVAAVVGKAKSKVVAKAAKARTKVKAKVKAAKAKPKAKVKVKGKAKGGTPINAAAAAAPAEPTKKGLMAKAKAATQALVARAKAATEAIVAKVKRDHPAPDSRESTPGMEPFVLSETSPGKYSLLLTTFDAAAPAFESTGVDAGGYAWEGVAKHVVATDVAALGDRISFDPEASMFCAFGDDRAGLEDLGKRLSSLYHDLPRLTEVVQQIGRAGFDD